MQHLYYYNNVVTATKAREHLPALRTVTRHIPSYIRSDPRAPVTSTIISICFSNLLPTTIYMNSNTCLCTPCTPTRMRSRARPYSLAPPDSYHVGSARSCQLLSWLARTDPDRTPNCTVCTCLREYPRRKSSPYR